MFFCKPVRYFFFIKGYQEAVCIHPKATITDLVSGKRRHRYCSTMRETFNWQNEGCGHDAKWFELNKKVVYQKGPYG